MEKMDPYSEEKIDYTEIAYSMKLIFHMLPLVELPNDIRLTKSLYERHAIHFFRLLLMLIRDSHWMTIELLSEQLRKLRVSYSFCFHIMCSKKLY
jgi:hypothetical protein